MDASQFTLETCEITVKVVKIGKRNITRSIFQQLPTRDLIDTTVPALFDGAEVWGWLNLHNSTVLPTFVVQHGKHLYRCQQKIVRSHSFCDYSNATKTYHGFLEEIYHLTDAWYVATILDKAPNIEFEEEDHGIRVPQFSRLGGKITKKGDTCEFRGAVRDFLDPPTIFLGRSGDYRTERREPYNADARAELTRLIVERGGGEYAIDPKYWLEQMAECNRRAETYAQKWDAIMDQLEAAEQLYIAT